MRVGAFIPAFPRGAAGTAPADAQDAYINLIVNNLARGGELCPGPALAAGRSWRAIGNLFPRPCTAILPGARLSAEPLPASPAGLVRFEGIVSERQLRRAGAQDHPALPPPACSPKIPPRPGCSGREGCGLHPSTTWLRRLSQCLLRSQPSSKAPGEQQQQRQWQQQRLGKQSPSSCLVLLGLLGPHCPFCSATLGSALEGAGCPKPSPCIQLSVLLLLHPHVLPAGAQEVFWGTPSTPRHNKAVSRHLVPCHGYALLSVPATPLPASLPQWVLGPGPVAVTAHGCQPPAHCPCSSQG